MRKIFKKIVFSLLLLLLVFINDKGNIGFIDKLTSGYQFDILLWEIKNLPKKYTSIFKKSDLSETVVRKVLEDDYANSDLIDIELFFEKEISKKIKQKLDKNYIFPPLDFVIQDSPKVLVISPRDSIVQQYVLLINSNIPVEKIIEIENSIDRRNFSSIIVNTGGFASYPSMVKKSRNYDYMISTISHEWLHQYLFFHPLGQAYFKGGEMIQLNETLADIFGQEIANLPEEKNIFYPDDVYNNFLKKTRLQVDKLLKNKEINEAEKYMKDRTIQLQNLGYKTRKINQAYFAFHGNYGSSPSSLSNYDTKLLKLRNKYNSFGLFLDDLEKISNIEEFNKLINLNATENK